MKKLGGAGKAPAKRGPMDDKKWKLVREVRWYQNIETGELRSEGKDYDSGGALERARAQRMRRLLLQGAHEALIIYQAIRRTKDEETRKARAKRLLAEERDGFHLIKARYLEISEMYQWSEQAKRDFTAWLLHVIIADHFGEFHGGQRLYKMWKELDKERRKRLSPDT